MTAKASIFKTLFLCLCVIANTHFAYAQTASLLPNAVQQFLDNNGKPLTSGTVTTYVPNTTTKKTTWQDSGQATPWANPLTLDAGGKPPGSKGIYGDGTYRQVVKDRFGNLIWDTVTSSTGSGGGGGSTATGDGDLVGTIKPWAGMTAPNQYVFTYGQELSRTTYAALFAAITSSQSIFCNSGSPTLSGFGDTTNFPIGAPVEVSCIAAGFSTIISKTAGSITLASNANVTTNATAVVFPWGNGNHVNTFNVPDFRGVPIAGNNNMGGVASSNATLTYWGVDPNSVGALGGNQSTSITLLTGNLPAYTPAGSIAVTNGTITFPNSNISSGPAGVSTNALVTSSSVSSGGNLTVTLGPSQATTTATFTGTAQGGASTPIVKSLIQPIKTSNYIIKVTPDANSATASGVTSLGGMTGSIACGAGLLCTGNTITSTTTIIQPPVNVQNYGAKCDAVNLTGNTTNGSTTVNNLSTTAGLTVGQNFLGGSIQIGSVITAIGANQVTISLPATGTFTNVALLSATDDSTIIQTILNTNRTVLLPALCYVGTSTITVGNLAWQTLTGINSEGSALISTSSTNPIISVVSTIPNIAIKNLLITRPSFVLPSATAFGIKFNGFNDTPEISGVEVSNSYVGIKLTGTGYGIVNYNFVHNNLSDGFLFQDPTIQNEFQWVLNTNLSEQNAGCAFHVVTPASAIGGQPRTSMGTWNNPITFSNGNGLCFNGNATIPLQGIRINGGFIGTDVGSEMIFDTYNTSLGAHQIIGTYMEQNTTGPCVSISANNTGGMYFTNNIVNACNTAGINNAGTSVYWESGALTSAGTYAIVNSGGLQVVNANVSGSGTAALSNSGTYVGRLNSVAAANTAVTVAEGGTGQTTFTANLPLIGNGTTNVAQGTRSGNTTSFATTSGTLTSGNCAKFDASGNIVDNGTTCGGGGGGSPGGSNTQVQYNNLGAFGGITGATTNGTTLTLVAPVLGTPASVTLTNGTGLPTTGLTGTLQAAQEPAHTGDVTNTAGSLALTLATVNANVGSFGSATQCTIFTVNAKGLITAASQTACISGLVVGTTTISSGSSNGVLYDTAGGILATTTAGTNGQLFLGNTGNPPQWGTMSGDATIANTGAITVTKTNGTAFTSLATTTPGTGVITALGVNVGTAGAFVTNGGALGTPSSGTVTNLTGTASININGTVGATTPSTGAFTTLTTSSTTTFSGLTASTALALDASKNVVSVTNTGSGNNVLATSPTLVTPTLGAASATSLTFSSTSGIIGTTTNNNAASGSVGEYLESVIASGSAVAVATTNTPQNITGMTITLTAGDWDVDLQGVIYDTATTVLHNYDTVSISTTTGAIDTTNGRFASRYGSASNIQNNVLPATGGVTLSVPPVRFSVSGSTQLFATIQCGWSGAGTPTAFGILRARRVR